MKQRERCINDGYVFSLENGKTIHPDSITTYLSRLSKKYDLPHINAHAFRHTLASLLFFGGADSVSVSKRLGHANVSTIANIYAYIIAKADENNAELLSKIIYKNPE